MLENGANILTEEKLDFPRRLLVWGNLGLLSWLFLAFFSVLFYNLLYGWLYLLAVAAINAKLAQAVLEGWRGHSSEKDMLRRKVSATGLDW